MKVCGLAAQAAQLLRRPCMIAWLAEGPALARRHLIGTDDQRIGEARCDRARFEHRQAQRGFGRRLPGQRTFIAVRAGGLEAQTQALQKLAAIPRGRSQHKLPGLIHHIVLTGIFQG